MTRRLCALAGLSLLALAGRPQTPPAVTVQFGREAAAPPELLTLWYRRPAADHPPAIANPAATTAAANAAAAAATAEWVQALPIGNGHLGAMIFGGVVHERLQLNENTLWAGGPYDPVNPDARAALPEVRRLIFDGKYADAVRLVTEKVLARPVRQMPYQPLGDLWLTFPAVAHVDDYRRSLNLETAVATTAFEADGVRFTR